MIATQQYVFLLQTAHMILVTGATGLVGTYLLAELNKHSKLPIRAIYRNAEKLEFTKTVLEKYTEVEAAFFDAIDWVQCDVTDIPNLEKAFEGITQVYHVAGCVSFQAKDKALLMKVNREGTSNMVNLSLDFKVEKFCYVSSIAVLNKSPKEMTYSENSHWDPEHTNSIYAISKYGGEMEIWRAMEEGLNAVIVNPGVILGSGYWQNGSGRLFSGMKNGSPFYFKGGTGYVDVRDVVKVMRLLMEQECFKERFILVAENWSFKKCIEHVTKALEKKAPSREIGGKTLYVISFFESIFAKLSNYKAKFPNEMLLGLFEEDAYDNSKIKEQLGLEFTPIEVSIAEHGSHFLKGLKKD